MIVLKIIGKRNKKTIGKRKKRSFNDRFQKRLTTLSVYTSISDTFF